jgi:hypothetical protein
VKQGEFGPKKNVPSSNIDDGYTKTAYPKLTNTIISPSTLICCYRTIKSKCRLKGFQLTLAINAQASNPRINEGEYLIAFDASDGFKLISSSC